MTTLRVQVQLREAPRKPAPTQPARVARLLALAHRLEREVRAGTTDLAGIARRYGLTRARVTQLLNLTLLAPTIQADLAMGSGAGHPTTERTLRPVIAEVGWERQILRWVSALTTMGPVFLRSIPPLGPRLA